MTHILKYLHKSGLQGRYLSDYLGKRIEVEIYGCTIKIPYEKEMTLSEFKKQVNSQYLDYIKIQADWFKSISDAYSEQISNYKHVII